MRKINYILDANNYIIEYREIPFSADEPYIEIPDEIEIHPYVDKVINGVFTSGEETIIKKNRILELKEMLAATDYQTLKFMDGALSEEEYAPIRAKRQAYRNEINLIEQDL